MIQSRLREQFYPSYANFNLIFLQYKLSKDFLRQLVNMLPEKDRKYLEDDIVSAATIVRVLSDSYLYNAITYIEDGLVYFNQTKEDLEYQHAIQKFKYRYQWQQTPQYQMRLNRKIVHLCDECGTTLDMWVY